MAKSESISLDQWEFDLGEAASADGWTVAEIAARCGRPVDYVRQSLKRLIAAGKWAHVGQRACQCIDGRRGWVPVYAPTAARRKAKPEPAKKG